MEVINQPAGHVELGETLQEAAVRETLEETGWLCEIEHAIGIYHYLSPASHTQYLRICFAGKLVSQEHPGPTDANILSAEWMTLQEIEAIHTQTNAQPQAARPSRTRPSGKPEVLRCPIVLTCFQDYERGIVLPWHCLQEQALMTDRGADRVTDGGADRVADSTTTLTRPEVKRAQG